MLQKAGGLFQLLAEVDFGTSFGLKSLYYKSRTSSPADAGQLRLARADVINWRNQNNDANLSLSVDSSDNLFFNGVAIVGSVAVDDTDSINLSLIGSVVTADLNLSSASATSGSVKAVASVESDGLLVQMAQASAIISGPLSSADWSTFNSKQAAGNYITALTGDVAASGPGSVAATIQAGVIVDSMVSASAAIAFSKLAALTSAHILVGSAGNVPTDVAVSGDISLSNAGVTAYAGTVPLNKGGTGQTTKAPAFDALSPMSASGDIIYGGASGTGTRLVKGSDGQKLTLASGLPIWASGNANLAYSNQTTTYAIQVTDDVLLFSGASFTATLPTAVGNSGKVFTLKHGGTSLSQVYTLATTSAQTIGGIASAAYALYTNGESLTVMSDGANWIIVGRISTSPWVAYTPTFTGFGTATSIECQWARVGPDCKVRIKFTPGTVTGVEARISLPGSSTSSDSSIIPSIQSLGIFLSTTTAFDQTDYVLIEPSVGYFTFGQNANSTSGLTKVTGLFTTSGRIGSFAVSVPITGWQP